MDGVQFSLYSHNAVRQFIIFLKTHLEHRALRLKRTKKDKKPVTHLLDMFDHITQTGVNFFVDFITSNEKEFSRWRNLSITNYHRHCRQ